MRKITYAAWSVEMNKWLVKMRSLFRVVKPGISILLRGHRLFRAAGASVQSMVPPEGLQGTQKRVNSRIFGRKAPRGNCETGSSARCGELPPPVASLGLWQRRGENGRVLSMIEGISAVTLGTHEMPRAVQFYRTLGFEVLHGGEDSSFTSFRAGSSYLNLITQATERRWSWWGWVIFYVADVDALYDS